MNSHADDMASLKPQELRILAKEHFKADRFEEAIAALDLAERSQPARPATIKMRMLALIKLGRMQEAESVLPQMVAVEREDEDWLRGLGRMAVRLKRWEAAAEAWSRFRAANDSDPECLRELLNAYTLTGNHASALEIAERLAAMGALDAEQMRRAAEASVGLGLVRRAAEYVNGLHQHDRQRTTQWLDSLEGPWWVLVRAIALFDMDAANATSRQRVLLQAAAYADGIAAEVRGDWVAAYAAYRAANMADRDNGDVADGLKRMRERLAPMVPAEASRRLATADALAVVFSDDELNRNWDGLLQRIAGETDWQTAARRLHAALPRHLAPAVIEGLKRRAADSASATGVGPAAAHFGAMLAMLQSPREEDHGLGGI